METINTVFEIKGELKDHIRQKILDEDANNPIENMLFLITDICYENYKIDLAEVNRQRGIQGKFEIDWTYSRLLDWVDQNYGTLATFAVQYQNYEDQVLNGGHQQYWDNGYASDYDKRRDLHLHCNLLCSFRDFEKEFLEINKYDSSATEILQKEVKEVKNILLDFPESVIIIKQLTCINFDEDGEPQEWEDEYAQEYLSEDSKKDLDRLDNKFYKDNLYDKVRDILNLFLYNCLFTPEEQEELKQN